jgi:para-aminobenzoate synthetase / 4-amino-4-deoxychorismate lyase
MAAETPDSVLLQTSRFDPANRSSFLFLNPLQTLSASKLDEIPELFRRIEEALGGGFYVAGFVGYECGYCFQSIQGVSLEPSELPLAWFGVYRTPLIYDHRLGCGESDPSQPLADEPSDVPGSFVSHSFLTISEDEYCGRWIGSKTISSPAIPIR